MIYNGEMYTRLLTASNASCLLLGPRGTGKSTWTRQCFPDALVLDLLEYLTYSELLARPDRLGQLVEATATPTVVTDEVQGVSTPRQT